MYSLGIFNEGGGSYTAAMRYLSPGLESGRGRGVDPGLYLTIVVSALSGVDQLLSITTPMIPTGSSRFAIGAVLAAITWYLTIRGRGEVFAGGLQTAGRFRFSHDCTGDRAVPCQRTWCSGSALYRAGNHTISLAGCLSYADRLHERNGGALRPGSHVEWHPVRDQRRFALVKWGKQHMPKLNGLWNFYSGKSGIGRMVQTSFLFYGGLTTAFPGILLHFTSTSLMEPLGGHLIGNLAFIGFTQIPGGSHSVIGHTRYWPSLMLAAASMTAFQDAASHRMARCGNR